MKARHLMRLFDTVSQVTHYFKYIKTLNKKAVFFICHYISGNKTSYTRWFSTLNLQS